MPKVFIKFIAISTLAISLLAFVWRLPSLEIYVHLRSLIFVAGMTFGGSLWCYARGTTSRTALFGFASNLILASSLVMTFSHLIEWGSHPIGDLQQLAAGIGVMVLPLFYGAALWLLLFLILAGPNTQKE